VYQDKTLGQVLVDFDIFETRASIFRQARIYLLTTSAQFFSTLFILFFLLKIKILTPVKRLINQSKKLARKELDLPFVWERTDEMGVLGRSFEQTRQSLLKLFERLKEKHMQVQLRAKELAASRELAQAANRAKSEFVANMSHELRTPLNHIMGFTELVLDKSFGTLNKNQEEYLKNVMNSSRHLLSFFNARFSTITVNSLRRMERTDCIFN
jgi:signal transduction histidine kinase